MKGRIFKLEEENIMGEVWYKFNVISLKLIFFGYFPPFDFDFQRIDQNGGYSGVLKDKFVGHISENLIIGYAAGWHYI